MCDWQNWGQSCWRRTPAWLWWPLAQTADDLTWEWPLREWARTFSWHCPLPECVHTEDRRGHSPQWPALETCPHLLLLLATTWTAMNCDCVGWLEISGRHRYYEETVVASQSELGGWRPSSWSNPLASARSDTSHREMTRHHMGWGQVDPVPCDDVSSPCWQLNVDRKGQTSSWTAVPYSWSFSGKLGLQTLHLHWQSWWSTPNAPSWYLKLTPQFRELFHKHLMSSWFESFGNSFRSNYYSYNPIMSKVCTLELSLHDNYFPYKISMYFYDIWITSWQICDMDPCIKMSF